MRSTRTFGPSVAAAALALSMVPAQPSPVLAQPREIRVLVPPLVVSGGVNRRFGERVADEVRKAIADFGTARRTRTPCSRSRTYTRSAETAAARWSCIRRT